MGSSRPEYPCVEPVGLRIESSVCFGNALRERVHARSRRFGSEVACRLEIDVDVRRPLLHSALDAPPQIGFDEGPRYWNEYQEAYNVGQDSGGDEYSPGEEDENAVHQGPRGQTTLSHLDLHGSKYAQPLLARQVGADECCRKDQPNGWQRSDVASNLDQESEFDDRNHEEEQK